MEDKRQTLPGSVQSPYHRQKSSPDLKLLLLGTAEESKEAIRGGLGHLCFQMVDSALPPHLPGSPHGVLRPFAGSLEMQAQVFLNGLQPLGKKKINKRK